MISRIPLRIVVRAPFVTRSSDSGEVGIDLPIARDATGKFMIAKSHIIGKLGAAMRELCDLLDDDPLAKDLSRDIDDLFGSGGKGRSEEDMAVDDKKSSGREARRAVSASDFVMTTEIKSSGTRTRIAIDNVRGIVMDGMMQVIEQPFPAGQELEFIGELRVTGKKNTDRENRILKAMQFITQMGALRSVGYGQIIRVESRERVTEQLKPSAPESATRLLARLKFEDVFCAGEARNAPNTYTSADYVPGGVIKGAIAQQMLASVGKFGFLDEDANQKEFSGELAVLAREFGKIRILHAQPVATVANQRPRRAVPLSLAAIEDANGDPLFVDLAYMDNPRAPALIDGKVPINSFDWKDPVREAAKKILGIEDGPKHVLRVRTQVSDTTKAAMTSRLFGVEYTRGDAHHFLAEIDLSACAEPDVVARGLQTVLAEGLAGIGRGGAYAEVSLENLADAPRPQTAKRVVAVLQSAALLRDPSRPAVNLHEVYADAFAELHLPESIELKAAFVNERLAGGGFFRNRMTKGARYAPWLLTEAGSTFVFESKDDAEIDVSTLFPQGLGVPKTVLLHHGLESEDKIYRFCPYLPQNGYGELSIGPTATQEGRIIGTYGFTRRDAVNSLKV